MFVTGEPGIGKTTLVESFLAAPGEGPSPRLAVGQCVESMYGTGDPYLPLLDALERLARGKGGEVVRDALRRHAPAWRAQMSSLVEPDERAALVGARGTPTPQGMLRELAALLEALTAEQDLVLWLEDLHWADHPTLLAIAYLARRREPARLLLIGSYRPAELLAPDHPLARVKHELLVQRQAEEMALGPLPATAIAEYLAARLGEGAVSDDLTRHVHVRTEGNPLFMVTAVDDLLARGAIRQIDGTWGLTGRLTLVSDIPSTVRQLIEQQIDRLPPEDRQLLEVASAVGVECSAAAIAAGLAQDSDRTETRCADLARQGRFFRARGEVAWPDGTTTSRFAFAHAVLQQILYERIPPGRRQACHARIGARLEAAYGETVREVATELAAHFERARDVSRAVRYFRLAGENALGRAAHAEAIAHLSRALALLEGATSGRGRIQSELELLVALGPAWIVARGYAAVEVEQTYQRALALCRQLGRPPELARVLQGLWNVQLVRGDLGGARVLAGELLERARRGRDARLLARAHAAWGETSLHLGQLRVARQHLAHALTLGRRHAPAARRRQDPRVAVYASWGHWMAGFPDRARTLAREALDQASALGHPHNRAFALGFSSWLAQFCGDAALVAERASEELALCREHGIPYWLSWGVMLDGWVRARQGQAAGLVQMAEGLAAYRATGAEVGVTHFLVALAETHGEAGRPESGLPLTDEALGMLGRTATATTSPRRGASGVRSSGSSHALARRAPASRPLAATIPRWPVSSTREISRVGEGHGRSSFRAATAIARLWHTEGRTAAARRLLAPLNRWFREGADTLDLRTARALLADLSGQPPA